ncbi:MAG: primase [Pseudomonadota bacterium]|jgi:DNA primase catalytic core
MTRIPAQEVEQLKTDISVARLVESAGIALKKSGKDQLGLCPFHEDGEPSLVVSPAKNLWHCFACQIGGGPIDWVMKLKGVSFRHAVELLRDDPSLAAQGDGSVPVKRATTRSLPPPVEFDADEQALLNQTIDYYHETLTHSPEALAYLAARGLVHPEMINTFKLGYANRTLGLRLPEKNRAAGAQVRARLEKVGIYRESGHEHFNGSLVVPVLDEAGNVLEVYGRKINDRLRKGTPNHLYLPGPHRGVWNLAGLVNQKEIILCEALIDALTFWCAGFRNVTASYGVEGFTADHLALLRSNAIERVLIAYDRDEAGEKGAEKLAAQLLALGIECYRVRFPQGMDANSYALGQGPDAQAVSNALGACIRKAQWLGKGEAPAVARLGALAGAPAPAHESAPAHTHVSVPAPALTPVQASAPVRAPVQAPTHTHESASAPVPLPASPQPGAPAPVAVAEEDNAVRAVFGDRSYRVRGLAKNSSPEVMKINLLVACGERFHVDTFDLYAARARGAYITQAATLLRQNEEVIRADLGKLLMQLETMQDERLRKALAPAPVVGVAISDEDRAQALALLKTPDLLARITADLDAVGIIGEGTNKLVGYLAATSRKLAQPLAIVIRSSSAAGKTSLMDAVLALMPPEERIKYSAMTGQSLFYMGQANLKHKILALAEEEGASRASYALKLLQSEGELTMASTGKDPVSGNLITQEYRVEGPVMLFTTTTALDIDPELLNRCLVLSVDEGQGQTQAIHHLQRQRRTMQGFIAKQEKDAIIALHQNAQRLLRPLAVLNPYADMLRFPDHATRTRRDHEKYLTLIDAIALLHQHQRQVKSMQHKGKTIEYIEVTKADIAHANTLAHEVLGRSLDDVPPQTRNLLGSLCGMVDALGAEQGIGRADVRFTRREAREALGLSDTQLRLHLERLIELEYVLPRRDGAGGKFFYALAYDGNSADIKPHLPGLIDVSALDALDSVCMTNNSRGESSEVAGRSRGDCAPFAVGSRLADLGASTGENGALAVNLAKTVKTHIPMVNGEKSSYSQASYPCPAPGVTA